MPPTIRPQQENIPHESQESNIAVESYPLFYYTLQVTQEPSRPASTYPNRPSAIMPKARPVAQTIPTLSSLLPPIASQPITNNSNYLQKIVQGEALEMGPRKPRQSKECPGQTSKSVMHQPGRFRKPRKKVSRTYNGKFKLQVLSYWLYHKNPHWANIVSKSNSEGDHSTVSCTSKYYSEMAKGRYHRSFC
ncbi:hypothetical protein HOY82DRAFT_539181 [Tuber indicum]|nr:hypothetical protein HOY82DRAFT_539181 [Tuber indicum]